MAATKIEWTDHVWNPVVGCSVISPGCTNCYAMKLAGRLEAMGSPIYKGHTVKTKAGFVWNGKVAESNWGQMIKPLSWKRPRRIFVNSMSDLFHKDMPEATIDRVFAVMALCPQHTFQVLTKRADRMRDYFAARMTGDPWAEAADHIGDLLGLESHPYVLEPRDMPLPNVWLGVSVEDQARAEERIPLLLETPAAKRFLSCEPLLGSLNLRPIRCRDFKYGVDRPAAVYALDGKYQVPDCHLSEPFPRIDWVIVGGESGQGARPMHPDWARSLRDQCQAAGVPFFFKQHGEWIGVPDLRRLPGGGQPGFGTYDHCRHDINHDSVRVGKKSAGRLLDGRTWDQFPSPPSERRG